MWVHYFRHAITLGLVQEIRIGTWPRYDADEILALAKLIRAKKVKILREPPWLKIDMDQGTLLQHGDQRAPGHAAGASPSTVRPGFEPPAA